MLKILVLLLLATSVAFAQDSSSNLNAPDLAIDLPDAPATQTTTTVAPGASPVKLTIGTEAVAFEADSRKFASETPIVAFSWVGAKYILNPKWSFKLEQNFQYASNRENLSGRDKDLHQKSFALGETMIAAAFKPEAQILGTTSVTTDLRYYAPTDRVSQENKELGHFRADTYLNWQLNPNWTLSTYFSPRVALNSSANINAAKGSDAEYYQLKIAPVVTYNFNDQTSMYYVNYLSMKSAEAQRGTWAPDAGNVNTHELGAIFNWGHFLINPALMSDNSLNDGSAGLFTSDSRIYSYETLMYYFSVAATF